MTKRKLKLVPVVHTCRYLNGRRFAYKTCGKPTLPGDPYCEKHHRLCYVSAPKATGRRFEFPK